MSTAVQKPSSDLEVEKNRRRSFLVERLAAIGRVTYEEVRERFGNIDHEMIRRDANALRKAGHKIEFDRQGRKGVIFSTTLRKQSIHDIRSATNAEGKEQIGDLCDFLLFGDNENSPLEMPKSRPGFIRALKKEFVRIRSELRESTDERIRASQFNLESEFEEREERLIARLRTFWDQPMKCGFIGSGTTAEAVARAIRPRQIPDASTITSKMTLWTNSRHIFYDLGDPDCEIKMVMLGGMQRRQSAAIVGEMPLKMLSFADPHFDFALTGTTSVDAVDQVIRADNDQDADIKNEVFRRSDLKIIVADSESKFGSQDQGSKIVSIFASQKTIDLIITDNFITTEAKSGIHVPIIALKDVADSTVE